MRWSQKVSVSILILIATFFAVIVSNSLIQPKATASITLLKPAPSQPVGYYDYFGKLLSPQQAQELVRDRGLNPDDPVSYQRLGAVEITQQLLDDGENIFFNRRIGDNATRAVLGGFNLIEPEISEAILKLNGQQTTNLQITLQKDITLGSRIYPKGSVIDTGLDVERRANGPLGLTNGFSCAICPVTHLSLQRSRSNLWTQAKCYPAGSPLWGLRSSRRTSV